MPTSPASAIPVVCYLVQSLRPKSILDIGAGFGKYGHLFREYGDINCNESNPDACQKKSFSIRVDAIEKYPNYITSLHHFLYDDIFVADAMDAITSTVTRDYDLSFMADVIEHMEKDRGLAFLRALALKSKFVMVLTPRHFFKQDPLYGNEAEEHRSLWRPKDFEGYHLDYQQVDMSMVYLISLKHPCRVRGFGNSPLARSRRFARFLRDNL